jgi:hypothetical protein
MLRLERLHVGGQCCVHLLQLSLVARHGDHRLGGTGVGAVVWGVCWVGGVVGQSEEGVWMGFLWEE